MRELKRRATNLEAQSERLLGRIRNNEAQVKELRAVMDTVQSKLAKLDQWFQIPEGGTPPPPPRSGREPLSG